MTSLVVLQPLAALERCPGERISGQRHQVYLGPRRRLDDVKRITPLQGITDTLCADVIVGNGESSHKWPDMPPFHVHHDVHVNGQPRLAVEDGRKAAHHHVWDVQLFQYLDHVSEEGL